MNSYKATIVAIYLIALYALILIVTSIAFAFNAKFLVHYSLLFSVAILLSATIVACINNVTKAAVIISAFLWAITICSVAYVISDHLFDNTWDGQTYHAEAVLSIAEGWNPFKDNILNSCQHQIFVQHYPKAAEIAAQSTYTLSGSYESGKMFNLLLIVCSFLLTLRLFSLYSNYTISRYKYLISFLIACNPISMFQVFSYLVDGQVSSCFIILLCGVFLYEKDRKNATWVLLFASIILANLKFTGLVYTVLILVFGLTYWIRKTSIKPLVTIYSIIAITVLFVGYNPYVRNTIEKHHPFYPLMGSNKVEIMSGTNSPVSFEYKNRFQKLYESTFARSRNVHGAKILAEPEMKIPLTFKISEWFVFKAHDVRYGGVGPLWSGILLICFFSGLFFVKKNWHHRKLLTQFGVTLTFILLTIIVIPECWTIRYCPQIWLLPIFYVILLLMIDTKKSKITSKVILFIICINLIGVSAVGMATDFLLSYETNRQLNWLRDNRGSVYVLLNDCQATIPKLADYHIEYTQIHPKDTSRFSRNFNKMTLSNSSTIVYYSKSKQYRSSKIFSQLSKQHESKPK